MKLKPVFHLVGVAGTTKVWLYVATETGQLMVCLGVDEESWLALPSGQAHALATVLRSGVYGSRPSVHLEPLMQQHYAEQTRKRQTAQVRRARLVQLGALHIVNWPSSGQVDIWSDALVTRVATVYGSEVLALGHLLDFAVAGSPVVGAEALPFPQEDTMKMK